MIPRISLPLVALVLSAPASLAAQSAQDFQLPPAPTPTPSANVQGPTDVEGGAVPVRPRAIPTETPTPTATVAPTPVPTITPSPIFEAEPSPNPAARTAPAPARGSAAATAPIRDSGPAPSPEQGAPASLPAEDGAQPTATVPPIEPIAPGDPEVAGEAPVPDDDFYLWIAGALGLLAALGALFFFWRRSRTNAEPPKIERPTVVRREETPAAPVAVGADRGVRISADAIKLTRSFANATLDYRVTLINRTTAALSGVSLAADMVSAHGDLPMEQQVATANQALEQRHMFDRIAPGQSVRYEGKIILPLGQARVIRQGQLALLVPLLRLKLEGAGDEAIIRTFVVGQGTGDGGRVAPFRLDEGPRTWSPIAARALD